MADITLTVDVSSLNKASKTLDAFGASVRKNSTIVGLSRGINTLQNNIRELVTAQQKGTIGGSAYQLGLLQVKRAYEQMGLSSQAATSAVRRYAAELQKQDAARDAEKAANDLAIANQRAASEVDKLSQKYDRAYAASKLYKQQVQELNQAERLGVITKQRLNKEIDQLDMELRQFSNSVDGAYIANNRFSQHINQTSNGVNKFGMYAQQVGYQVGDFFVQIQSGTNFLVAFGQQATQLAGLFPGILGAALGIGISLATAVGAAFMRTASDVESSSDRQVAALKNLGDAIKEQQGLLDELRFGGSATAFAENEVNKLESQISGINNLIQALTANIESASNSSDFNAALIARDLAEAEIRAQQETLVTLEKKLDTFKSLEEAQRMLNGGLSTAAGIQKGILYDKEVELRLAQDLKTVNQLVSEGLADPQKKLLSQQYYQSLLEAGVKPAQAMAVAQQQSERYLLQSVIASGQLNNEQLLAAQAALQIFEATVLVEEKIKASADITELLEQGLSLSVIEAMDLAGVDFTKLSDAALAAGVLATNLGISFGLASEIGKISAMSESESKIYSGVKSGLLPEAALNSIGLGPNGFTRDGSFPINMPGMMPDNPTTASTGNEGGTGPAEATQTAIEKLQEQLAVERELIGTSEAYQKVRQALGEEFSTTSPQVIAGLVQEATETQRLIDLDNQRISLLGTVKSAMEDTLMSIVDGTKSAKDAFKTMAAEIIKELYRVYVVQQLVNSVSGFFAPSSGVPGRAAGGSMMANMAYMVGEKGPELVIPRHSGTVVNAKQTANAIGGGGSITVQNNITVTGSDAAMVRTEVAKMIPQITNATKAAVLDAKQRGGQFAAAFR